MKYEKYYATPSTAKQIIKKYGVAIIPNLLSSDECLNMEKGMWKTLEHVSSQWETPIKRNNKNTWKEFSNLYPMHSMLLQSFQIGHSQFIWDLRQNKKCINVFSKIWDCQDDELLVSFDGASFHLPSEVTKKGWYRKSWYHTDQSYTRPDLECIQSWVTGYDVNKNDATLAFMEKSNRYHLEFKNKYNVKNKLDWYKLTEDELNFYHNKGCKERKIRCPAGSMVLWDSRTIHCGVEPTKGRDKSNTRCVIYLCYTPKKLASAKVLQKKIKAFEELRMTNHWPHKPKLFGKKPRTYGKEILPMTPFKKPKLTNLGKRLVGYNISELDESKQININI